MYMALMLLVLGVCGEQAPHCAPESIDSALSLAKIRVHTQRKPEQFASTNRLLAIENGQKREELAEIEDVGPDDWEQLVRLRVSMSNPLSSRMMSKLLDKFSSIEPNATLLFVDLEPTPHVLLNDDEIGYLICEKGTRLKVDGKAGRGSSEANEDMYDELFLEEMETARGSKLVYMEDSPELEMYSFDRVKIPRSLAALSKNLSYRRVPMHMNKPLDQSTVDRILEILLLHEERGRGSWIHIQSRKPQARALFVAMADMYMEGIPGRESHLRSKANFRRVLKRVGSFAGDAVSLKATDSEKWAETKRKNLDMLGEIYYERRKIKTKLDDMERQSSKNQKGGKGWKRSGEKGAASKALKSRRGLRDKEESSDR